MWYLAYDTKGQRNLIYTIKIISDLLANEVRTKKIIGPFQAYKPY